MEQISRKLPLRLIPTKGSQVGAIILSLVAVVLAAVPSTDFTILDAAARDGLVNALIFLVYGAVFLLVLAGLVSAIMKILPGSPYHYLEIAQSGLVLRQGFRSKRFAWSDLSSFVPHETAPKPAVAGEETTPAYYVLALPATDEALLPVKWQRYGRALFRIDPDDYGIGSGEEDANALATWLTEIRARVIANPGAEMEVTVPQEFQNSYLVSNVAAPRLTRSRTVER